MAAKGKIRAFMFLTTEGYTFQPGSEESEPDVENCQVIGWARGNDAQAAFRNLLTENEWLLETTFDELTAYELRHCDYERHAADFSLREASMKGGWRVLQDADGPDTA